MINNRAFLSELWPILSNIKRLIYVLARLLQELFSAWGLWSAKRFFQRAREPQAPSSDSLGETFSYSLFRDFEENPKFLFLPSLRQFTRGPIKSWSSAQILRNKLRLISRTLCGTVDHLRHAMLLIFFYFRTCTTRRKEAFICT